MNAGPASINVLFVRFADAFGWPVRVLEARRVCAQLAALSEIELHDLGGERPRGQTAPETLEERTARLRAIRAWHHAEAA